MEPHVERLTQLFATSKSTSTNGPRFRHVTAPEERKKASEAVSVKASPSPLNRDRDRSQRRHHVGVASRDTRENRTVFVGNLPLSTDKKSVKKLFTQCGHIDSIRFRSSAVAPGKLPVGVARRLHRQLTGSCINCYIVFTSEDSVAQSLELNGTDMDGRHLRVDRVTQTADHAHSVFVGNVPFSADEEKLRTLFERCGQVTSVRLVRDKATGIGKGFGYVLFTDTSGVLFACQQSGNIELDGRKLRVFHSKTQQSAADRTRTKGSRTAEKPFMGTQALTHSQLKTSRIKKPKHMKRKLLKAQALAKADS